MLLLHHAIICLFQIKKFQDELNIAKAPAPSNPKLNSEIESLTTSNSRLTKELAVRILHVLILFNQKPFCLKFQQMKAQMKSLNEKLTTTENQLQGLKSKSSEKQNKLEVEVSSLSAQKEELQRR